MSFRLTGLNPVLVIVLNICLLPSCVNGQNIPMKKKEQEETHNRFVEKMMQEPAVSYPAKQFRFARPTDRLANVKKFYIEGLGLQKLDSFKNHDGYDGIMIGLTHSQFHLEFTHHIKGSPCPAPTRDNLFVLYFENDNEVQKIKSRLNAMKYFEVEPENPYWKNKGLTFEDPDGWRVVLFVGTP